QPGERRQGLTKPLIRVLCGVVALFLRAEDSLYLWVVVKERKEYGNTLDNRRSQLRLDPFPIVLKPALHRFKLCEFFGIGLGGVKHASGLEADALILQCLSK